MLRRLWYAFLIALALTLAAALARAGDYETGVQWLDSGHFTKTLNGTGSRSSF
jgi:hypothetical protein